MKRKRNPFGGLALLSGLLLGITITAALVMETYSTSLDTLAGTVSYTTVTETTDDEDEIWEWEQEAKTAEEAFNNYKDFALREADETIALLKNNNDALPLEKGSNISMLGLRSYAAFYGNKMASIPDMSTVNDNLIYDCFVEQGFNLNPSLLETYETYCSNLTRGLRAMDGSSAPEYQELVYDYNPTTGTGTNEIFELTPDELAAINSNYDQDYAEYDTAVVIVGRGAGEAMYYDLQDHTSSTTSAEQVTTTGNVLGLTVEEKEVIEEAKDNFDKVVVIINATNTMEFKELVDDDGIDAIVWAGHPGAYGWHSVAKVLNGDVNPSAHLGDTFVTNNATNPALQSYGNVPWANASDFDSDENVNSYLIESEGIYTGYRYYETRYADIVMGNSEAANASAGTYTTSDYQIGTVDGTREYENEVFYPFGYGLSYTEFEQTLDSVEISDDKLTATVEVTVTNVGDVAGKSVIQVYGQAPYIEGGVEKSAIQLLDFEKTELLDPSESQTITMEVMLENLASYDQEDAETFIVDQGTYYIAIGDDSHDALNNILTEQGYIDNGDATKTFDWSWSYDATTFSTGKNGVKITNQLSNGDDYSMDINDFIPGTAEDLSRSDWDGTFPEAYEGLEATGRLATLLGNDFIDLSTDDDTSDYEWGVDNGLTIYQLKGSEWDNELLDDLVDQVTIEDFIAFAEDAFHNIAPIDSVSYAGNRADDGPGGATSWYLESGTYRGVAFEDAEEYTNYGSRVAPSSTNLAYSFNKELAFENGEIILGETSLMFQIPIMIGPGVNIHRHGYNARGGEYYSEDPVLSGFIGSNVIQGAQSKGVMVNIKHVAFNDQETNRSGVAVFMSEQKARELELRNLRIAFEASGKPASFVGNEEYDDTFVEGVNGVMTSYNRIGAVASSANYNLMVNIMREEWGFLGYNVTDFTGVSLLAAPKESLLAGTTAFCGFGGGTMDYWQNPQLLLQDADMCAALKLDIKYVLYSLVNCNAMNGTNETTHRVNLMTWWRGAYIGGIALFGILTVLFLLLWVYKSKHDARPIEEDKGEQY